MFLFFSFFFFSVSIKRNDEAHGTWNLYFSWTFFSFYTNFCCFMLYERPRGVLKKLQFLVYGLITWRIIQIFLCSHQLTMMIANGFTMFNIPPCNYNVLMFLSLLLFSNWCADRLSLDLHFLDEWISYFCYRQPARSVMKMHL